MRGAFASYENPGSSRLSSLPFAAEGQAGKPATTNEIHVIFRCDRFIQRVYYTRPGDRWVEEMMAETTTHRPALVRTRYAETDQMGFIYHSNFFAYFEIGRGELVRATGMTYADLEMHGIQMPIKECGAQFRLAARYDDLLAIGTRVEVLTGVRIRFGYQVHRIENGIATHLATGFTDHIFIDRSGRPTRVHKRPEIWPALERLVGLDTFPALDARLLAADTAATLR